MSKLPTQAWNKAKISPHIPLKTALSERENHSTNDAFWLVESRDAYRLYRPYIDPTSTLHRPHIDLTSTPHLPHIDTASTLHRPHIDPASTLHRPHIDSISTLHEPNIDPTLTPHRPHIDPTSTPYHRRLFLAHHELTNENVSCFPISQSKTKTFIFLKKPVRPVKRVTHDHILMRFLCIYSWY